MRQKQRLVIWATVGLSFVTNAQVVKKKVSKFDASQFSPEVQDTPAQVTPQTRAPRKAEKKRAPRGLLTESSQEILNTIKSINLLLQKDPSASDRVKLLLNRAMASYSLARKRLIEGKSLKIDSTGKRLLAIAIGDTEAVAKIEGIPPSFKSRAFYIRGLSEIYLDQSAQARTSFTEAINIDPKSSDAGWMALYIAEELFENSKFREAIPFYQNYQPVMDETEKELAQYKLAWAYINLQNPDRAQGLFSGLIKNNPEYGFGKDSIKDLAFLMTTYNSDAEILSAADDLFEGHSKKFKIEFLAGVLDIFEASNAVKRHSKILVRLLELEDDSVQKLKWLVAGMRASRKLYASYAHYETFLKLKAFVADKGLDPSKRGYESVRGLLDLEAQNLMRAYVETFAGRTKTPEPITHAQIGAYLLPVFDFYERHFKDTKVYPVALTLWLEVCVDLKDWPCVDTAAEKILDREDLKKIHTRVALDQLVALETLVAADPKAAAKGKLINRLEAFVNKNAESPRWAEIAKRLSDYYVKDKEYSKAIPLIEQIFVRESSPDSFYRLQWARFEAQKYAEIVGEKRTAKGVPDVRVIDLKREAALKLAIEARKQDEFKTYSKMIRVFLSLNPSPDKAVSARVDFFNYMIEKNFYKDLAQELMLLTDAQRFSKSYLAIVDHSWVMLMRMGQFQDALRIVSSTTKKIIPSPNNLGRAMIARLALGAKPASYEFMGINGSSQSYLLGVLALTKPDLALQLLMPLAPLKSKELRTIGALALRMQSGSWDIQQTAQSVKLLGAGFSYSVAPNLAALPVEKLIAKVDIPTKPLTNPNVMARYTQDIVFQTRRVRRRIVKDIERAPLEVKIRTITKAKDLELRTAGFIKNQPIPQGLSGAQIDEYEMGVANVVKEFTGQADEFEKLIIGLGSLKSQNEQKQRDLALPLPDMTEWPWPAVFKTDAMKQLREVIENHNFAGALLMLDLFRPDPLKDEVDYYKIRSGILLSSRDSESLRRYVLEELEASKQDLIANSWRGMVNAGQSNAPQPSTDSEQEDSALND